MNNETIRTCSDERPCINCYADQGECLGPAPETVRQRDAATLKAAQGGVTEARTDTDFTLADLKAVESIKVGEVLTAKQWEAELQFVRHQDEIIRNLQAALSAQQGQGEAVCTVGMFRGNYGESYDGFSREDAARLDALPAGTKLYTAPPAQPAERVPEESYRGVPYRVLGKAFQRALADPNVLWRDNGGAQEFIDRVQEETRLSLLASPAPSPARGDGGEG